MANEDLKILAQKELARRELARRKSMPTESSNLDKALNVLDYPGRVVRTAIGVAGSDRGISDIINVAKSPTEKAPESISGKDLLNIFPKIKSALIGKSKEDAAKDIAKIPDPQLREYTLQKLLKSEKPDFSTIESVAGMIAEAGTDPITYSGPLLRGGSKLASKGAEKLGIAAKELSYERAAKSLGRMTPTEATALGKRGTKELGKAMIEGGIIGGVPKSTEKLAAKVTTALDNVGSKIGKIVEKLGSAEDALRAKGYRTGIDKAKIIDAVMAAEDLPHIDPNFQKLRDGILENFSKVGGGATNLSIRDSQAFKQRLGSMIDWKKIKLGDISDRDRVLVKVYESLSDGILDAADGLSKVSTDSKLLTAPGMSRGKTLADEIRAARAEYSNYKQADKILQRQIGREAVNRTISPSDYIAGAAGGIAAGPQGMLAGAANKLLRERGSQMAATLGQGISKAAPTVSRGLRSLSNSQAIQPGLLRLLQGLEQDNKGRNK